MPKCPDYYLLADGREFAEFSKTDLSRVLWQHGVVGWPYHCAISALEHLFRMGRKEGEEESDWQSFRWWWSHVPDTYGKTLVLEMVLDQRDLIKNQKGVSA